MNLWCAFILEIRTSFPLSCVCVCLKKIYIYIYRERERERGCLCHITTKNATIDPKNVAILFCVTIATCKFIAVFF